MANMAIVEFLYGCLNFLFWIPVDMIRTREPDNLLFLREQVLFFVDWLSLLKHDSKHPLFSKVSANLKFG